MQPEDTELLQSVKCALEQDEKFHQILQEAKVNTLCSSVMLKVCHAQGFITADIESGIQCSMLSAGSSCSLRLST